MPVAVGVLLIAMAYAFIGWATWTVASCELNDDDRAAGLATIWPITIIFLLSRSLFRGIRYWVGAMSRLAQRARPVKKIAPRDPILEAAKREVEAIAPEHPDA